ncbi:Trehalose transport system permease protein SugA [Streptomyces sp. RB5]|uniref:Trehalose transport system permease protein SugA n=1 Tax=Streptomyces smaragdinus TaxID=2585196 RepID=A0A7K0CBF7_9ACTN|nr:sugar ABC transporter permease [Streptomyces smaragdinus]MQY10114.1 Trehalose transport system permease protein SugA [Streptomyces smaragdinus]
MTAGGGRKDVALRHRLAERGIDRTLWLLLPGVAFLVVLFCYPFAYGLGLSFQPKEGGGPFANYRTFFSDPYLRETVWITLRLAVPAALINVLASVPVAFRTRGRFRGRRTVTTLLVIPVTLGTVLTAEGLLGYLGPAGWFNKALLEIGLIDQPLELVHNYWGVLASLLITGFPFAYLLTLSYLTGIDPSLEQAAATLGAGWWQRFRTITLPLLTPGLAITFCLTFVLAYSVFPSAQLVGDPRGSTHVISIEAYDAAFKQFDYSLGSAIAMIMALVMLAVVALVLVWRSTFYRGATGGKG